MNECCLVRKRSVHTRKMNDGNNRGRHQQHIINMMRDDWTIAHNQFSEHVKYTNYAGSKCSLWRHSVYSQWKILSFCYVFQFPTHLIWHAWNIRANRTIFFLFIRSFSSVCLSTETHWCCALGWIDDLPNLQELVETPTEHKNINLKKKHHQIWWCEIQCVAVVLAFA